MVSSRALLDWYASLQTRTVDLVGDYAGDELFLIEGDSLLLHTFSDKNLDFNPGFQLLHATYIVENFLRSLYQRKCNFQVVFFKENAWLCIPPNTPPYLRSRCLLAREAIIQHLQHNLSAAAPSIGVKQFDSYRSQEFLDYLSTSGTYFFMCHDGAFSDQELADASAVSSDDQEIEDSAEEDLSDGLSSSADSEDSDEDAPQRPMHALGFRFMINWFVGLTYNIALVNGLECRDTKVMVMIVEGVGEIARKLQNGSDRTASQHSDQTDDEESDSETESEIDDDEDEDIDIDALVSKITDRPQIDGLNESNAKVLDRKLLQDLLGNTEYSQYSDLSQSDLAVVVALSLMFKSGVLDNGSTRELRAMLLHTSVLHECSLSDRAVKSVGMTAENPFLENFAEAVKLVLTSEPWKTAVATMPCDLADLIDGRLFCHLLGEAPVISEPSVVSKLETLASLLNHLCGVSLKSEPSGKDNIPKKKNAASVKPRLVLPFSNPVFNPHLAPVHLSIDKSDDQLMKKNTSRVFQEISHWHNHRRPVGGKGNVMKMTEKQIFFAHRRNQFFMAEMRDYAASLTNAAGGLLEPESVFVRSAKDAKQKSSGAPKAVEHAPAKGKEKKGTGKASAKNKPSIKEVAAAANEKKRNEVVDKQIQAWVKMRVTFDKESNLAARYLKVKQYLMSRPNDNREVIQAEVSTYLLNVLLLLWTAKCAEGERDSSLHIAAFIWDTVCRIARMKVGVTTEIAECLTKTVKALRLPAVELDVQSFRKSTKSTIQFTSLDSSKAANIDIGLSATEFQLLHAAPFFDRNMGSAPDPRVRDFEPDEWQRNVLDEIDAKRSLFVVAPTSAGKTFISFYAMKKILEEDDDGVLVYVAPTKALVNQIAAEVQARFSKSFKHGGKSVWAIHTRDYRINNPTGCQVLVTVPHILQIMLLAPANANSWSSRVKRIIFDEIHCIGQVEDGVVWEQLLLLSPCPIIALSATVGNPQKFSEWLGMTQKANGVDLTTIEYRYRYSDLRKYVYNPPQKFVFNGLPDTIPFAPPGLDNALGLAFMHPVASLVDRSRGMPDDLTLEARDCLLLWNAMTKHQTPDFPVDKFLNPAVALPKVIRKVDIVQWEAKLKVLLKAWMEHPKSPFELVLKELTSSIRNAQQPQLQISSGKVRETEAPEDIDPGNYLDTTLPLICSLHQQGGLPALFFNYDRVGCESIGQRLLAQLKEAEDHWKESSPAWKNKLAGWEAWKTMKEKMAKKKGPADAKKKGKRNEDDVSPEDQMQESASAETSSYELFDPETPVEGFHFADFKKLTPSEFEECAKQLRRRLGENDEWLIAALRRGIGVHHAGMNRKYRQVVETLFRKGYLRVVIATGTLALGINMPCKTVIFSGDSVFLTALNFRQAAGRAGRRGFDMLGNVVFQGLSYTKVCRLLSSKLPDLNGHFPITTSLVLRLFTLLHESKQASNAVKMVNSVFSCARVYSGGGEAKQTVLHHLRFSIEYLRRSHLLGPTGIPLNFAGCVSHLYFVENASFAFHALLKDGYFHGLCKNIDTEPKPILLTLMTVMSHLFGRRLVRPSIMEDLKKASKKWTSVVVLPRLPAKATKILQQNNKETLRIYSSYVETFVDQHVTKPDCNLPLTGMKCGGDKPLETRKTSNAVLPPVRYTSAFYALSGHRDKWENISDLCATVRSGVWLEKAVVPYVEVHPEGGTMPLNAYLYDFYKHGNIHAIEQYNGIRRSEIWFLLNDFSLVLATIVTSLENFLKLSPSSDADMIEVMGSGDAHEEERDVGASMDYNAGANEADSKNLPIRDAPSAAPAAAAVVRKKKVVDSWEDEADEDEILKAASKRKEKEIAKQDKADAEAVPTWDGKDYGIINVLKGFKLLQEEFNIKFREMWA